MLRRHAAVLALAMALVATACQVSLPDGSRLDCRAVKVTRKVWVPPQYKRYVRRTTTKVRCTPVSGPTTTTVPTTTTTTTPVPTTAPPPAGPAALVTVALNGVASGGALAVDDVEVRGGAASDLYLSDNFSANLTAVPVDYGTGSAPTFVTSDPSVNTSPVLSGFGLPADVWFNPLSIPDLSTPQVVSGRLRPPPDNKLGQLIWDLTAAPVKVSFKVSALPVASGGHAESASLMFIDPAAQLPAAAVQVTPYGVQLLAGELTTGLLTATAAPVSVSAGDRVALSRQGTVYEMWRNATLLATVDVAGVGTLTGTVSGVGDPSTCVVDGYASTDTTGALVGRGLVQATVAGDGTFVVPALSTVPLKLRASCSGSAGVWLGGGSDADRTGATTVTATAGTAVPVGDVALA